MTDPSRWSSFVGCLFYGHCRRDWTGLVKICDLLSSGWFLVAADGAALLGDIDFGFCFQGLVKPIVFIVIF